MVQERNGNIKHITLGIDPDSDKIGVATYNTATKQVKTYSLKFFELYDTLLNLKEEINIVKIEAGWLNKKSNFHFVKSPRIAENIANKVGRNAEVGRKIVEMCIHLNIPYQTIKPFGKIWKTKTGKISHNELTILLNQKGLWIGKNKTNQDQRDAILIAII